MYLVPQDIYKRLLDSADSREKIKIGDLNKFDVGNESGAFPDTPLTPEHLHLHPHHNLDVIQIVRQIPLARLNNFF